MVLRSSATKTPKGVAKVIRRGPDGEIVGVYYYAWKAGPRLRGTPGSREFKASYDAAMKARSGGLDNTLGGLALQYQSSPEFAGLADSTQKEWRRRISKIAADAAELDIGGMPISALNDPRVKADILAWRDQWRNTPRGADFLMQVLSRVLSWGQQRGLLTINVVIGLGRLYKNNRADQVWTADELERYAAASSSPEISFAAPLACLTGLRLDDLHTLAWSEVGEFAIVKVTKKGRGKRTAVIPLLPETRDLLARIRAQQVSRHAELVAHAERIGRQPPTLPLTVLSNTLGRRWAYSGLETRVNDTKAAAHPPIDKHLHDARGTFATRLRKAGLTAPEIADVLGWDEDRVEKLLTVYVDRDTIVKGIAERVQRLEAEAKLGVGQAPAVADPGVPHEVIPLRQAGSGVVHHVDFHRRPQVATATHNADHVVVEFGGKMRTQQEKSTMKRALIDLCAYVGETGVERRSTLVSDEWLEAELARDPWLFRVVDIDVGHYDLPPESDAVRWLIPDEMAKLMARELRASYG